nr:PREDICTED: COP9 signalosome complex subunit 8-like isoform X2 [Musa acuminata subsp. malaccensis]
MAEIVSQPDIFEWMAERRRCSSRHGPLADTKHPSLPNRLRPLQCDELVLQERSSIAFLRVASRGIPYREEWPFAIHLLGERSVTRLLLFSKNGAKFLWKSMPREMKESGPELVAAWKIGQCL